MVKHWRKCSLCGINSYSEPSIVIFKTGDNPTFVCELHYVPEQMYAHGNSKR